MSKETIEKIFKKLPEVERKRPALIIDGKVLTWEELWIEVRNDGPLTKKILKKMEEFMKKWKK